MQNTQMMSNRGLLQLDMFSDFSYGSFSTAAKLDDSAIAGSSLGAELRGATFGLNPDSQYNIFEQSGRIVFYRDVNGKIQLSLASDASVKIDTSVDGYEGIIDLNQGQDSIIIIRQGG